MSEISIDRFRLIALQRQRGLTQGQLAIKSGISQAHLSRLQSGKRTNVKGSTLQRLAAALGVSPSELMPGAPAVQTSYQAPIDLSDPELRLVLNKLAELPPEDRQLIWDMIRPLIERAERLAKERRRERPGEG